MEINQTAAVERNEPKVYDLSVNDHIKAMFEDNLQDDEVKKIVSAFLKDLARSIIPGYHIILLYDEHTLRDMRARDSSLWYRDVLNPARHFSLLVPMRFTWVT